MKGKYAAKAANRTAAVDNEVAAELRAKLAAATAENCDLRAQLVNEQSRRNGMLLAEIEERSRVVVEEARDAATCQLAKMQERLDEAADLVAEFVREWRDALVGQFGEDAPIFSRRAMGIDHDHRSLLGIFEKLAPQRAGELVEICIYAGLPNKFTGASRKRRRRNSTDIQRDIRLSHVRERKQQLIDQLRSAGSRDDG